MVEMVILKVPRFALLTSLLGTHSLHTSDEPSTRFTSIATQVEARDTRCASAAGAALTPREGLRASKAPPSLTEISVFAKCTIYRTVAAFAI